METPVPQQNGGSDAMASARKSLLASVNEGMLTAEQAQELYKSAFERQFNLASHRPSQGNNSVMAHLVEQNDLELYPYKVGQKIAQGFRATRPTDPATYKERFERLCQHGAITPEMAMMCFYLLYSSDREDGVKRYLHLLLYAEEEKRTSLYNWEVFDSLHEYTQHAYGPYIEALPVPLIPGEDGAVKNDIILRRFEESRGRTLQGGSVEDDIAAGIYRRPRAQRRRGMHGAGDQRGGRAEVLADNMDGVEARLQHLCEMLQELREDLAKSARQPPNTGRAGRGTGQGAPPSNRGRSAGYGRGRGGFARYGRARGGPWTHCGGEAEGRTPTEN